MMVQITSGISQNLLVNMFGKLIPFYGMNNNNIPRSKFFLVFTSTTTFGVKALIKYDLNLNEVISRTYNQIGASTDVRSQEIYSPINDDLYYYTAGDVNNTTSRITRWDASTLGITQSAQLSVNRFQILDVGHPTNLVSGIATNIQSRSKTPITFSTTGTASSWTTTAQRKRMKLITDVGVVPASFIITTLSGTRRYTSNSTLDSFTQNWANATDAQANGCVIYRERNEVFTFDTTDQGQNILDLSTGVLISNCDNFAPTVFSVGVYKNDDVVFADAFGLRRRSYAVLKANNQTNVWAVNLTNVVYLELDEDENLYVVVAGTSNAVRKYDKNGTLLVSASLPTGANGYSGKLVHK